VRGALAGVTVVDVSRYVAGPLGTFWLANLGAQVIAVERPGGEPSRGLAPFAHADGSVDTERRDDGLAVPYLKRYRGKRSICISLDAPEGQELVRRLVAGADVFVENSKPGAMARRGLGYERLSAVNSRLVYCSVSGFGQDGPDAGRPAMDHVVQARSGLMAKTGFADGPPTRAGATVGDFLAATFAALGIVAALHERDRTGRGDHVDVAMLDALSALVWDEPVDHYAASGFPVRTGNTDPRGAGIDVFATRDGHVAMCLTSNDQWAELAHAIGRPEWVAERATIRERATHRDEINAAIGAWCATRTTAAADAALLAMGVPAGAVRAPIDALDDVQLREREFLVPLRHPGSQRGSWLRGHRLPVAFAGRVGDLEPPEPLGASTAEVLRGLGLSDVELASLRDRGVIDG
jgi:crotonobetainyl-CoA:carnitine CoA-transferase CaiB-like acyl-CoA transferase